MLQIPYLDAVNRGSGLLGRAHHLGHIARLLIGRLVVRDQNDGAAAFARRAAQVERRVIQRIVEGGAAIGAESPQIDGKGLVVRGQALHHFGLLPEAEDGHLVCRA